MKKLFGPTLFILLSGLVVHSANAQALDFGQSFLPLTGLGNADIRVIIAAVIKIGLGFLGIIALGMFLYGGFLWMTAGGNEEKVSTAKKLITNAVIGVVIIMSAYAITSFVISRLSQATRAQGSGGDDVGGAGGGGGRGLPPEAFVVRGIAPQGKVAIRNVKVRITFSRNVDAAAVNTNVSILKSADKSAVPGQFAAVDKTVEFTPAANCPAPNQNLNCFDADTEYTVEIKPGLKSRDGKNLICGLGGSSCRGLFITGNLIDTQPPQVNITSPTEGQAVSADSQVVLEAQANDDAGISQVQYLVNDQEVDTDAPNAGNTPLAFKSVGNWSTVGLPPGSIQKIKAKAFDIDNNQATSTEVKVQIRAAHCFNNIQDNDETAVDCGGKACGACQGQSCTVNSDCSSGVCVGGKCLELPQIDEVLPASGAPGNWVTLKGKNFGAAAGQVMFLGKVSDPSDDLIAQPANCNQSWGDNQVIIEVPQGAVTGPLKLTAANGFFDQTSDARGFRGEFLVNTDVRPGLCSIAPTSSEDGGEVSVVGKNFGTTKDLVLFASVKSGQIRNWTDTQINGVVVPNINFGKTEVTVAVKNEKSNPVAFEVLKSANRPVIDWVSPAAGAPGQYITVNGSNFGSVPAAVKFVNVASKVETLADVTFPQICANDYWKDDYVIVKVPGVDVGGYFIKVVRDNKESNSVAFTVNRSQLTPGLCRVDPDNGPIGTMVNFYGDNFGSNQGKVNFYNRQEDGRITQWQSQNVKADVAPKAATGPVKVINSEGTLSNQVLFKVGICSANSCPAGQECCGNGICQKAGTCSSVAPMCTYSWIFSTGILQDVDPSLIPNVVDDPSCRDGNPQSPTPYKGSLDACANAQISARFDKNMSDATLNAENIVVQSCNNGGVFDSGACKTQVKGAIQIIGRDTESEGFMFGPEAPLANDTWYRVTIKAGVKSVRGINLYQDYVWQFKTKKDAANCLVDFVEVVPDKKVLEELNAVQEFVGLPTAQNCNILNPNAFVWNWATSDAGRAKINDSVTNKTLATALAETEPGLTVRVAGAIPSQNKADYGELTIVFARPQVTSYRPQCQSACVNAKIGATFSLNMNPASLTAQTFKLFSCVDNACDRQLTPVPLVQVTYAPVNREVEMVPVGGLLAPGKFYRAVVMGTAAGVKSVSNTTLTGLNYSSTPGPVDSFSWIFKTQANKEVCVVDRVDVSPKTADLYLIGINQDYVSQAFGAPDECDPKGQQLNAFFYNWSWLSTKTDVASITSDDALPKDKPDNLIDPYQKALTDGPGSTKIQTGTQTKAASGDLNVLCGFTRDNQCPPPATLQTFGVGNDTCCRRRPKVVATNPLDGATAVCRNALVVVEFDEIIHAGTLEQNFVLEANYGSSPCPAIEGVTSNLEVKNNPDGTQTRINWCRWPGSFDVSFQANTSVIYQISKLMESNREYRVVIRGDQDLTDQQKAGLLSGFEVAMNGSKVFKFTTGSEVCNVEAVDLTVTPPGQVIDLDFFSCADRDDCPGDFMEAPGNQHSYTALAKDRRGFALPAEYRWSRSGTNNVVMSGDSSRSILVTSKLVNGESTMTVFATGKAPTTGSASRTQKIQSFICENPWPNVKTFPYTDASTNFSLFYCRDSGKPGLAEDLPAFVPSAVKPGTGDVIKEFLFIQK